MTELDKELEVDLEGLEFEGQDASYQIWVLTYDEADNILDEDFFIKEYNDPNKAIEDAKFLTTKLGLNDNNIGVIFPKNAAYVEVVVETVVEIEDYETNVATLFSDHVILKK
jgi:hypothetical protein